jgi:hypothetical protein
VPSGESSKGKIMLDRADVERITENMLHKLSIHVKPGNFIDPNDRVITLKYDGEIISETYFDVTQKDEYEG